MRNRIIAAYSSDFQNIDAEINKLRDAGYGWGEVIMALELAQLSGKTVEEIMAMREDDKGWGEIARVFRADHQREFLVVRSRSLIQAPHYLNT